ncbi:MAG: sodium:solute symporter family protein [Holosporaceae bacterium]|jgi:SSS family solute:Na+ symporter|nr:sodium:solute symporter family protein [Holosporaceae bacterium]
MNVDIAIVCVYLVATLIVGLWAGRNVKTMRDFSVSDGTFSTTVLTMTIMATWVGGNDLIGVGEKVFKFGITFTLAIALGCFIKLIIEALMAPKIVSDFSDKMSIGEIMGTLYGRTGQLICSIGSVMYHIGFTTVQVSSMGYICEALLGIPHIYGCIIGSFIVIAYSIAGGIRSVVFTDVLQFFVLLVGIPLIGSIALGCIGGFTGLTCRLPVHYYHVSNFPSDEFVYCMMLFLVYCFPNLAPAMIQRMLMARSPKQAVNSIFITSLLTVPFYSIVSIIGLCAVVMFPSGDPNHAIINVIRYSLPTVLKGIAISGILAVIMSTADSLLNTAAVSVSDAVNSIMPRKLEDRKELLLARASTVILGFLSIFIAVHFYSLVEIWVFFGNFWTPIVCPPIFLYILFNIKTSVRTYVVSVLMGGGAILAYRYLVPEVYKSISLVVGALIGTIIMFILYKIEQKCRATSSRD